MPTTPFTSFLPEVMPSVAGCSDLLAVNALRNACIEFCSNSMYWQETQDDVTLSATDFPYDMPAPSGARVIQPLYVGVNGYPVEPKNIDWLDNNLRDWRNLTSPQPQYYYQPNPNQLVFVPSPDAAITVTLRAAYCPTRTATGIEEWVYQNYLEALASGALTRLMATPGQPFTNPEGAQYHRGMFNTAMTDATIEANKAFDRGGLRIQIRGKT